LLHTKVISVLVEETLEHQELELLEQVMVLTAQTMEDMVLLWLR
jgi:hypothetical protein